MTRLIAFIDGSNYTPSVLDHAAWASSALGAEVDVVHVIGRRDAGMPLDWSGNLELGARSQLLNELAEHDAERARLANERARLIVDAGVEHLREAGVAHARPMVRRGDIVEAIQDLEPDARLFIIGKRGEAADFAKMHLGSNLERVVRVSKKPVIVASRAFKPVNSFLVAYDGGPSAEKAVDHIANGQLFPGLACHLMMAGREAKQHRANLEQATSKLSAAGYSVTVSVEDGEPEGVISEYVKAHGIDLLVMGAYGHSKIRSLIIGSTTTEMIRSVLVPVMLFR